MILACFNFSIFLHEIDIQCDNEIIELKMDID